MLGGLALMLGMFVIFHTLSHSIAGKIRAIGILRALGAGKGTVGSVFLLDAFAMSVLGTATGLGLGILIAKALGAMKITTLGLGKTISVFQVPKRSLIYIGILGMFFTMLGAAFPLLRIRKLTPKRILYVRDLTPPADLMRGVNLFLFTMLVAAFPLAFLAMTPLFSGEGRGAGLVLLEASVPVGLFFSFLLLAPRIVKILGSVPLAASRVFFLLGAFLVKKNLFRSPGRMATSVCGLTLVGLSLVGVKSITGSLKEEIRNFAAHGLERRFFVRCEPCGKEVWRKVASLDFVQYVLPLGARIHAPFLIIGTDMNGLSAEGAPLYGRKGLIEKMKRERGMIVSTRLSELKGLKEGDSIVIPTDVGAVEYKVVLVSDDAGFFPDERIYGLVDMSWLKKDFCIDVSVSDAFSIKIKPGYEAWSAEEKLAGVLGRAGRIGWIRTGEEVEQAHIDDVDRDFLFFDILLFLLVVLAGTGQVNLMTLTALAREREIGVLRALGVRSLDFFKVLILEGLIVGWMASLLVLGAGIPMSYIVVRGLREVGGLMLPYSIPWRAVVEGIVIVSVVSLLATILPAWNISRKIPAYAVRTPE